MMCRRSSTHYVLVGCAGVVLGLVAWEVSARLWRRICQARHLMEFRYRDAAAMAWETWVVVQAMREYGGSDEFAEAIDG